MLWDGWRTQGLVGIRRGAYLERRLRELIA
jgi:hypothetical protein